MEMVLVNPWFFSLCFCLELQNQLESERACGRKPLCHKQAQLAGRFRTPDFLKRD
jgi:hypothetical protein